MKFVLQIVMIDDIQRTIIKHFLRTKQYVRIFLIPKLLHAIVRCTLYMESSPKTHLMAFKF